MAEHSGDSSSDSDVAIDARKRSRTSRKHASRKTKAVSTSATARRALDSDDSDAEDAALKDEDDKPIDPIQRDSSPKRQTKDNHEEEEENEEDVDNGDEDEEEEEDEEEDEEDEDDEDEDEDDEDDEDEDEDGDEERSSSKRGKKKRRREVNPFIEMEASVDEEDEEEDEEDEDDADGFLADESEDVAAMLKENKNQQQYLEQDRRRAEDDVDAEAVVEQLRARYGNRNDTSYSTDFSHLTQAMLIPSPKDPKLWLCGCRQGCERLVVSTLMQKFLVLKDTPSALRIFSAFTRSSVKGFVYIEAYTIAEVMSAIDGVNNVYPTRVKKVQVEEMVDCITIKEIADTVKVNDWVRVKKGKYQNDLAKVIDVVDDDIVCYLIPRLGLPVRGRNGKFTTKKQTATAREPQKLFSPADFRGLYRTENNGYSYDGEWYNDEGFLEKSFKRTQLITSKVQPSLDEISMFSESKTLAGVDTDWLNPNKTAKTVDDFSPGDNVEVTSGTMVGIKGVVEKITKNEIVIKPKMGDLASITVLPSEIDTCFSDGDEVTVVSGKYVNESGIIVSVLGNKVTLISDSTRTPIEVLARDLKSSGKVVMFSTLRSLYGIGDLVTTSKGAGIITRVEGDVYTLLSDQNMVINLRQQQIRGKRDSARTAAAHDSTGKIIRQGAQVEVLSGSGAFKMGSVFRIYQSTIFVKSQAVRENAGYIAARASNIRVVGNSSAPFSRDRQEGGRTGGFGSGGGFGGGGGGGGGGGRSGGFGGGSGGFGGGGGGGGDRRNESRGNDSWGGGSGGGGGGGGWGTGRSSGGGWGGNSGGGGGDRGNNKSSWGGGGDRGTSNDGWGSSGGDRGGSSGGWGNSAGGGGGGNDGWGSGASSRGASNANKGWGDDRRDSGSSQTDWGTKTSGSGEKSSGWGNETRGGGGGGGGW